MRIMSDELNVMKSSYVNKWMKLLLEVIDFYLYLNTENGNPKMSFHVVSR